MSGQGGTEDQAMHVKSNTLAPGILVAGAAAGPIYVLSTVLSTLVLSPSDRLLFGPNDVGILIMLTLSSIIFGAIIGLPVSGLGGALMAYLGKHLAPARLPVAWACAGTCIGLVAVMLIDSEWITATPLLITCTTCAWLTNRWVEWEG